MGEVVTHASRHGGTGAALSSGSWEKEEEAEPDQELKLLISNRSQNQRLGLGSFICLFIIIIDEILPALAMRTLASQL